jgi:glycosyltransferase involved in cell wall biosynthesis
MLPMTFRLIYPSINNPDMSDSNSNGTPKLGIVYFGNEWHAENRTSSHHIARQLAGLANVVYIDSPGMRPPTASTRDLSRIWKKLSQAVQRPSRVAPGLWHCTVPQIPFRHWPGVSQLNRWFGAWAVKRAIRVAGIREPVLWFVAPHPCFLIDVVPHALVVFYCVDDYASHPGVDAAHMTACDALLTKRADHIFVAPPALVDGKRRINPATTFSPHGVDVDLFWRAQSAETVVPSLATDLKAPVIGYFGLIAAWTDIELVEWLAVQRPQWNFLLVGHAHVAVDALARLPNVRLVGPQPYESLPGWAKAFDVAIIPYRMNRQVQNANPLKLREYLATGKPVVTMPTPEVERFSEVVRIAKTREEFLAAIEASLQETDMHAAERRKASVRDMSWESRANETLKIVNAAMEKKRR